MKLHNLPVDTSYGDKDIEPTAEPQTEDEENEESEEATKEQKRHAEKVLGFSVAELWPEDQ